MSMGKVSKKNWYSFDMTSFSKWKQSKDTISIYYALIRDSDEVRVSSSNDSSSNVCCSSDPILSKWVHEIGEFHRNSLEILKQKPST